MSITVNFILSFRKGVQRAPSVQKYVPAEEIAEKTYSTNNRKQYIPLMPSRIIDDFNTDNPDPLTIAKKNGFNGHLELADYMKSKGFTWIPEIGNEVALIQFFRKYGYNEEANKLLSAK